MKKFRIGKYTFIALALILLMTLVGYKTGSWTRAWLVFLAAPLFLVADNI